MMKQLIKICNLLVVGFVLNLLALTNANDFMQVFENSQIKNSYYFYDVLMVQTKYFDCITKCKPFSNSVEVFQTTVDLTYNIMFCRCFKLRANIVKLSPSKFMETINSLTKKSSVYVMQISPFHKPLLFYLLDDINQGTPKNTLTNPLQSDITYYPQQTTTFNCTKIGQNQMFLRLIPTVQSQYEIMYNISTTTTGGGAGVTFASNNTSTVMTWFKRQFTDTDDTFLWRTTFYNSSAMFLFNTENTTNSWNVSAMASADTWTHVAVTYTGNTRSYFVNGTLFKQVNDSDYFTFGPNMMMAMKSFDGCLAHLAVFDQVLTVEEIKSFSDLF